MDEKTKEQTKKLLETVRKNAQMGTVTLETLAERLAAAHRGMADIAAEQLEEYRRIADAAGNKVRALGKEPEDAGAVARTAAAAMVSLQSLTDRSPSHIAEMIIIGSTRGVISAIRALRSCPAADPDAIGLACRLVFAERSNIEQLRRYI